METGGAPSLDRVLVATLRSVQVVGAPAKSLTPGLARLPGVFWKRGGTQHDVDAPPHPPRAPRSAFRGRAARKTAFDQRVNRSREACSSPRERRTSLQHHKHVLPPTLLQLCCRQGLAAMTRAAIRAVDASVR